MSSGTSPCEAAPAGEDTAAGWRLDPHQGRGHLEVSNEEGLARGEHEVGPHVGDLFHSKLPLVGFAVVEEPNAIGKIHDPCATYPPLVASRWLQLQRLAGRVAGFELRHEVRPPRSESLGTLRIHQQRAIADRQPRPDIGDGRIALGTEADLVSGKRGWRRVYRDRSTRGAGAKDANRCQKDAT